MTGIPWEKIPKKTIQPNLLFALETKFRNAQFLMCTTPPTSKLPKPLRTNTDPQIKAFLNPREAIDITNTKTVVFVLDADNIFVFEQTCGVISISHNTKTLFTQNVGKHAKWSGHERFKSKNTTPLVLLLPCHLTGWKTTGTQAWVPTLKWKKTHCVVCFQNETTELIVDRLFWAWAHPIEQAATIGLQKVSSRQRINISIPKPKPQIQRLCEQIKNPMTFFHHKRKTPPR